MDDPTIGRFVSFDPLAKRNVMAFVGDTQQGNGYAYVGNNPVMYTDPSGEFVPALMVGAAAAYAAFEISMSAYDTYDLVTTMIDQSSTDVDRIISVTGFLAGVVGVGGGYGPAGKQAAQVVDDVVDATKNVKKRASNFLEDTEKSLPGKNKQGWTKLKGGQGWKDQKGNIWKKDQKHKDHWDVSDRKGNKIQEVDFEGNNLWPEGPKNKNKKP